MATMTDAVPSAEGASKPRIPESVRRRSQNRAAGAPAASDGPSPGRILAAAGSVSLGIGLVAVLATTSTGDVTIEVNPTPVIVQPAPLITEVSRDGSAELRSAGSEMVVITGAEPASALVDTTPVARSEGS